MEIERIDMLDGVAAITLKQYYKGIPVKNSTIGFSTKPDGSIVSFGADLFPGIKVNHKPSISRETALQIAAEHFGVNYMERTCEELVIYPVKKEESFEYYLTWQFHLESSIAGKSDLFLVDASNGNLIKTINQIQQHSPISGKVTGKYFPEHYSDPIVTYELSNVMYQVYDPLGNLIRTGYTDEQGSFSTSVPSYIMYSYKILPKGNYVQVFDFDHEIVYTHNNWKGFPGSYINIGLNHSDDVNVYYHVNYIHDYFANNHNFHGLDYSMVARINHIRLEGTNPRKTGGRSTGTEIWFGKKNDMEWAKSSDVIYHEYTHNVVYSLYNGWIDNPDNFSKGAAMGEALSDYFACTLNNDPLHGESVDVNRYLDDIYQAASSNYTNSHDWGKVISSACWDIRQQVGQTIADDLVFKALQISPQAYEFIDYLENLLLADKIYYNSLHAEVIKNAFSLRGIYPTSLNAALGGPNSINYQGSGTWSVSPTGGVTPYTYRWDYKIHCEEGGVASFVPADGVCGAWIYGGTSNSITLTANSDDDIDIRCIITDNINQSVVLTKCINITGTPKVNVSKSLPEEFVVKPNHPNPFNPVTTIAFGIPESGKVLVNVYNSLGQLIKQLSNTILPAGNHKFDFNASQFSSGIYYYTIIYQNNVESRKMILMK